MKINWMEKIAGKGAADRVRRRRAGATAIEAVARKHDDESVQTANLSRSTEKKSTLAEWQDLCKRNEHIEDQGQEIWDPFGMQFHYFSGAECSLASPIATPQNSFSYHPDRPLFQRSQSELMPQLRDSSITKTPTKQWGGPDPTCYEVPHDRMERTYSSSTDWDPAENPVVPLPYTVGIGCYRRDPNTSPEWREEKYKSHVGILGPRAAHACGAYDLAGIEPEFRHLPRKESFASQSSYCSSASRYSEISDEQGRITKVYRGFTALAYPAVLTATQGSEDRRHSSVSTIASTNDGPYPRQAIRPRSRVSFLSRPEQADEQVIDPILTDEAPALSSRTKSSITLELATPGHAESAIHSESSSWEETAPEILKKPVRQPPKHQGAKNQVGRRGTGGKASDHKTIGSDRSKGTTRKSNGGALRRCSSHDRPTLRRSTSDERRRANVQPALIEDLADPVRSETTLNDNIGQKLDSLELSVVSEAEKKKEEELALLKEDDIVSTSSTSSERTALPSLTNSNQIMRTRRNRSGTAILACSIRVPRIPEAREDCENERT